MPLVGLSPRRLRPYWKLDTDAFSHGRRFFAALFVITLLLLIFAGAALKTIGKARTGTG